jgi:hypothetical protein
MVIACYVELAGSTDDSRAMLYRAYFRQSVALSAKQSEQLNA